MSDDFIDFATCNDIKLPVSTYIGVPILILETSVNEIHRKDKVPQLHICFLPKSLLKRQNSATSWDMAGFTIIKINLVPLGYVDS